MKYRFLILTAALLAAVPLAVASAGENHSLNAEEPSALEKIAPEAGGNDDAEDADGFAVQQKIDEEEASWMKGTIFDNSIAGGAVQDPATLQRRPYLETPKE